MPDATLARILARWHLSSQDLCAIVLFGLGHPEQSPAHELGDELRGQGPAAVARGVSGVRRTPAPPAPLPWRRASAA